MTTATRTGGFRAIYSGFRLSVRLTGPMAILATCLAGVAMPAAAQQGTWSTKAPMPTARVDTNAVVLDGKVYVIGGTLGKEPFTANEEYDPATDRWRARAPMPRGIYHQGLAVAG